MKQSQIEYSGSARRRSLADKLLLIAGSRLAWLLLLLAVAFCYYGSYYRHGINFRDEGGTVTLLSKRLLEGERPFRDVVLGYNVLWFYPVVSLFQLFGVSFVLLRVYCFVLATATAVLAFLAVLKAMETRARRQGKRLSALSPAFAFGAALFPLLVPGMTFKNYIPLLTVANSFCLLHVALEPMHTARAYWKTAVAGVILGLTFLIRIDLGIFFTVLWLGLHALRLFDRAEPWRRKFVAAPIGVALIMGFAVLMHVPVYLDAERRGFETEFVGQYSAWIGSLSNAATVRLRKPAPAKMISTPSEVIAETARTGDGPAHTWNRDILRRKAWRDFIDAKDNDARELALLTYAPLISLVPLVAWASIAFFGQAFSQSPQCSTERPFSPASLPLAALVMLGGALTAFPQFFFFRPDAPHLSEFSPAFWVAVICSLVLLGAHEGSWLERNRLASRLLIVFVSLHAVLYLWRMLPDRWTGTIAVRKGRSKLFEAENGVRVYVSKREHAGLTTILGLIRKHSGPGEYLVAYPYHPSFNVLADRPTYEKNVYVDNATRTKEWDAEAIARFKQFAPAVIILSDWDINSTGSSRFSVWALETKTWIQTNYVHQGTYLDWYEVYTRPTPATEAQ